MRRILLWAVIASWLALLGAGQTGRMPWAWVGLGVFVGVFALWPIAVAYANTSWPLSVTGLEVLPDGVPTRPASDEWARATVARLAVHGFTPRLRYRVPGSRFLDFGQSLHNELTGEVALIMAGAPSPGGDGPQGLRTVTFCSRLTDGGSLETTNSPHPGLTPDLPGDAAYRLPEVTDVDQLYAVHRRLVKGDGRRVKPIVLANDPLAWERDGNDRSIAIQVGQGLAVRDEKAGVLCPTIKGAIRAAWRLHPWVTAFHRRRETARARAAVAAALAARGTPSASSLALRSR